VSLTGGWPAVMRRRVSRQVRFPGVGLAVVFGAIHHRPPRRVAVMYCSPSLPFRQANGPSTSRMYRSVRAGLASAMSGSMISRTCQCISRPS
jgi:hypothetical protein